MAEGRSADWGRNSLLTCLPGRGISRCPSRCRPASQGLPRYRDAAGQDGGRADTFVLSGAEDLVPVADSYPGRVRYRPRTEGLFARIEHVRDDTGDYWEVRGRGGLFTRYGTARPAGADGAWRDPAVPADPGRVFGWRITETRDLLGNLIRYEYRPDAGQEPGHTWNHPLLACVRYADFGDRGKPSFLVTVHFAYELTDVLRSGSRLTAWFNDQHPDRAWPPRPELLRVAGRFHRPADPFRRHDRRRAAGPATTWRVP